MSEYLPARPHAGHRTTKSRWPSSKAGATTVVVPHITHGGGDGWNSSGMTMAPSFQAGAQLVSQPPTPRRMPLPMMEEASAAWQFPDVDARNVGRGGDEQVRCNKNWKRMGGAPQPSSRSNQSPPVNHAAASSVMGSRRLPRSSRSRCRFPCSIRQYPPHLRLRHSRAPVCHRATP